MCEIEVSVKCWRNGRFEIIINAAPVSDKFNGENKKGVREMQKNNIPDLKENGQVPSNPGISNNNTNKFQQMFPGSNGSLYGLNLSRTLSTFRRQSKNKNKKLIPGRDSSGSRVRWRFRQGCTRQKRY